MSFDGFTFTYDHLHAISNIDREKLLNSKKVLQLLTTYLMRSVVLGQTLLKYFHAFSKIEGDLKTHLKEVQEGHELNQTMMTSTNERITALEKEFARAKVASQKDPYHLISLDTLY